MPSPSLLQILGSKGTKDARYAPIFTDRFFVGYWSNRNPLRSPLSTFYAEGWHLGGTDALLSGVNAELSPRLTICRRPGNTTYSTATFPTPPLTFYPFELFGAASPQIDVIVDSATNIYTLTPTAKTSIFSKAVNAGQSNFLGIGQTLYFGDGAEVMAWQNGTIRNWGISIADFTSADGPNTAGTGAGASWTNPSNITGSGGFATINLTLSAGGSTQSAPLNATNFGFTLGTTASIAGVKFTIDAKVSGIPVAGTASFAVQMLKNGSPVGNVVVVPATTSTTTLTFGGTTDLFNLPVSPNDVNQTLWGMQITAVLQAPAAAGPITFSAQLGKATLYGVVGPVIALTGGTITATNGYKYVAAYGNSQSEAISNATPPSVSTGSFGSGISAATVASPGSGYVNGDTGTILGGTTPATYTVASSGGGGISTAKIHSQGSGYHIGDAGTIGAGGATYVVNHAGASGHAESITVTAPGTGYSVASNVATSATSGTGTGLTVDITGVTAGGVLTFTITSAGSGYAVGTVYATLASGSQPGIGVGFSINVTAIATQGVQVSLVASTDPQVNQIWLFRTADGGSTFLNLPTSPYPNTTQDVVDSSPDSQLNILLQAAVNLENSPPQPPSLDPVLYLGLVWVHVGNAVYFTRVPSAIAGNTYESFPPANVFTFPETVIKKIPFSSGLLIFTTGNVFVILGNNTAASVLYSAPFLSGYGVLSWNAVWTDGSIVYFFTSDNRMIELNPSSGVSDIGFPIGDQLKNLNPSSVYVTYNSSNSNDVGVYVGDGSTGWYRCNPNQAPDGAITGPVWSVKANIVGGCGALVGMQTSPGIHALMMGGTGTNGPVLVRNSSYTTFTDNGTAYPSNFVIGSIVLAQPGQAAICRFITCDFIRTGTSPILSVLLGEISGSFENISGYVVPDPPYLAASTSLFNNRYYFKQTVAGGNPLPVVCRHLQMKVDFGSTDTVQNELISSTVNGAIFHEK